MSFRTVTWDVAKGHAHDASGIDNPQDWIWLKLFGIYYPYEQIKQSQMREAVLLIGNFEWDGGELPVIHSVTSAKVYPSVDAAEEAGDNQSLVYGIDYLVLTMPSASDRGVGVDFTWSYMDVLEADPTLDKEKAMMVLKEAKRHHDAEVGMNWDVIRFTIEKLRDESKL